MNLFLIKRKTCTARLGFFVAGEKIAELNQMQADRK